MPENPLTGPRILLTRPTSYIGAAPKASFSGLRREFEAGELPIPLRPGLPDHMPDPHPSGYPGTLVPAGPSARSYSLSRSKRVRSELTPQLRSLFEPALFPQSERVESSRGNPSSGRIPGVRAPAGPLPWHESAESREAAAAAIPPRERVFVSWGSTRTRPSAYIIDRSLDGPGARRSVGHDPRTVSRGLSPQGPGRPDDENLRELPRPRHPEPTATTPRVPHPPGTKTTRRPLPPQRVPRRCPRGRPPIRRKRTLRCLRTRTMRRGFPRSRGYLSATGPHTPRAE